MPHAINLITTLAAALGMVVVLGVLAAAMARLCRPRPDAVLDAHAS